jgi:hypothetical protein
VNRARKLGAGGHSYSLPAVVRPIMAIIGTAASRR